MLNVEELRIFFEVFQKCVESSGVQVCLIISLNDKSFVSTGFYLIPESEHDI